MKEAWAQGYTGRGIVVSILDDGIEKNHPDLAGNYVRRWRREAAVPGERHLAGGVGGGGGGAGCGGVEQESVVSRPVLPVWSG